MRRLCLLLAVVVVAASAAVPASAATPALAIQSIECGSAPYFGTGVEITGTGFTPGGAVDITYTNGIVSPTRTETADAVGDLSFSYTLTGSNVPPGTVTALDTASGLSATLAIPLLGPDCGAGVPTTKEQCKGDGWGQFPDFKNQGDCVSYVATNGRNVAG